MPDNILLLDKPVGFSSFQIVRVFKRCHNKVGHAGTLDPFASGLLIILVGSATKRFAEMQFCEKEYIGEMILGMTTETYDIAGKIVQKKGVGELQSEVASLSIDKLNSIVSEFIGEIEQVPPKFSAIKQAGKKLYELSRKGVNVQPRKRKVFVKSFYFTEYDYPHLKFNVVVGKGVYIRSLVHDFGNRLSCGATLCFLRRTRIGDYEVSKAKKLGDVLLPFS